MTPGWTRRGATAASIANIGTAAVLYPLLKRQDDPLEDDGVQVGDSLGRLAGPTQTPHLRGPQSGAYDSRLAKADLGPHLQLGCDAPSGRRVGLVPDPSRRESPSARSSTS